MIVVAGKAYVQDRLTWEVRALEPDQVATFLDAVGDLWREITPAQATYETNLPRTSTPERLKETR